MTNKKIVICYSGGLDSLLMGRYAEVNEPNADITKVYFDLGHGYNYKEQAALPKDVLIRKIDWMTGSTGKMVAGKEVAGSMFFPGRNLLLASAAASMFEPNEIWMGAMWGEMNDDSTDKNDKFKQLANDTLAYVFSPFTVPKIVFPFGDRRMGKLEAVKWGLENGISVQTMQKTSSCMSAEEGNCGQCIVCARRWGIFAANHFGEKYNKHPLNNLRASKYILNVISDTTGHYTQSRKDEFLIELKRLHKTDDVQQIIKEFAVQVKMMEALQ